MLAELANSLGPRASFPCIYGHHGGTRAWKKSEAGLISALKASLAFQCYMILMIIWQPCTPKTVQYICSIVDQQLGLAQNNKLSQIRELESSTGVLDRLAADAITILLEANDDMQGKGINPPEQKRPRGQIPGLMQELRDNLEAGGRLRNPLLELKGILLILAP